MLSPKPLRTLKPELGLQKIWNQSQQYVALPLDMSQDILFDF